MHWKFSVAMEATMFIDGDQNTGYRNWLCQTEGAFLCAAQGAASRTQNCSLQCVIPKIISLKTSGLVASCFFEIKMFLDSSRSGGIFLIRRIRLNILIYISILICLRLFKTVQIRRRAFPQHCFLYFLWNDWFLELLYRRRT